LPIELPATRALILEITNGCPMPLMWFDAVMSFSNLVDDAIDGDAPTIAEADSAAVMMLVGLPANRWFLHNATALGVVMGVIWAAWRSSEMLDTPSLRGLPVAQAVYAICIISLGDAGLLKYRDRINETIKQEIE